MAQAAIEAMQGYLDECIFQEKITVRFYQNQLQAAHAASQEARQLICAEGDKALRDLQNVKEGLCMGIDELHTGLTQAQQAELQTLQSQASCRFFWNTLGATQDSHLEVLRWAQDSCQMASWNPLEQDGFKSVLQFMTTRLEEGVPVLSREANHSLRTMGRISNIHISRFEDGYWFFTANQHPGTVVQSEEDLLVEKLLGTKFFEKDVVMED